MIMKLGILNAIHPDSSKVNWGGSPVDAYIRFLETAHPDFTYTGYNVAQGIFPAAPEENDAYIITGSPNGAYDPDPWIARLGQFIRDGYAGGQKFVGICFGHQMIAQALGGRVQKWPNGWGFGRRTFTINQSKSWMNGRPDHLSLYFAHQDQVTKLPPGAELLASDPFCAIDMYSIDGRILGIQGHPEFTTAIMEDLFTLLKDKIEPAVWDTAVQSTRHGRPDNELVAQWIVNFLQ